MENDPSSHLPEKDFWSIVKLASLICEVPIALISRFGKDDGSFIAAVGISLAEIRFECPICSGAISGNQGPIIVSDLSTDPRFQGFPLGNVGSHFCFYAGFPIRSEEGVLIGALTVLDHRPRLLRKDQEEALALMADQAMRIIGYSDQERQQKALSEETSQMQERNQSYVENTDGIFWEADVHTFKPFYVSPQTKGILGYTSEEWLSNPNFWMDHLHPEDREDAISFSLQEIGQGRDHSLDYRMRTKSGEYIWIHDRVNVYAQDGKATRISGMMLDITYQKKLEMELNEKAHQLQAVIDKLPLPFFLFDESGNYLLVNKAMIRYSEYSAEEYKQLRPLDLFEKEERENIRKKISAAFSEGEATADATLLSKSGKHIDFLFKGSKFIYEGKNCIIGIGLDVTDTKKTEKALATSEKKFRAIVQDGGDIITVIDLKGNFVFIGSAAQNILGYDPIQMLGKNAFDYVHPDDLARVLDDFEQIKSVKRIETSPYRFLDSSGNWRWLETILTNFVDDEAFKGILTNSRDITKQWEFQLKLEKSEARYRLFFESHSNYIIKTDLEGKYTFANKKFKDTFGWIHPRGIVGEQCMTSICDYHHDAVREVVQKCLSEPGRAFQVEMDKPTKIPGKVVTTLWDFVCLLDSENRPVEIQCSGIDITDRSQMEKQIKEVNERYELLAEASSEVIYEVDPQTGELFLGKNFSRIFGHPLGEETLTTTWYQRLMHATDKEETLAAYENFLEEHDTTSWNYSYRLRNAEGEYRWVEDAGVIVRNDEGKAIRVIGTVKDITEIRKIKELMESASYLSKVGGWEVNLVQNKMSWTPTTCDIFEVPHDYSPNLENAIAFYREDFKDDIKRLVQTAIEENKNYSTESVVITRSGAEKWVRSIGNPVFEDGKCTRVYGSIQDIHEKKLAEQELKRINSELKKTVSDLALSNQELEQFAYIASHDLQEPLRMITGFMGLLEKKYKDQLDEKAKQYIQFAIDGATRMKRIIIDLLEFSRVGRNIGNLEELDLNQLIGELIIPIQRKLSASGGRIELERMPKILSFETPIVQIFQNLIENAVKYSRKGVPPMIKIQAEDLKTHWLFSISDNGLGIPSEYFEKIFILFQRLHSKDEYSGSGIGLAIVKKTVELLGGKVWLESEEGTGSTFYFSISKTPSIGLHQQVSKGLSPFRMDSDKTAISKPS